MSAPMPNGTEKIMRDDDIIVSKTDLKGNIIYCNELFMQMSMMKEKELLGKPHNTIRHPDMPRTVFKLLWEHIKNGNEIFAYVKNRSADGSYYWVFANVTPSYNQSGQIIGYYSVRIKPNAKALEVIKPIYTQLLQIEATSGMDEAEKKLTSILKEKGVNYDEFIISLQAN